MQGPVYTTSGPYTSLSLYLLWWNIYLLFRLFSVPRRQFTLSGATDRVKSGKILKFYNRRPLKKVTDLFLGAEA